MPADDVSDLRDVVDAINRLCDTMKTTDRCAAPARDRSPAEDVIDDVIVCDELVNPEEIVVNEVETYVAELWSDASSSWMEDLENAASDPAAAPVDAVQTVSSPLERVENVVTVIEHRVENVETVSSPEFPRVVESIEPANLDESHCRVENIISVDAEQPAIRIEKRDATAPSEIVAGVDNVKTVPSYLSLTRVENVESLSLDASPVRTEGIEAVASDPGRLAASCEPPADVYYTASEMSLPSDVEWSEGSVRESPDGREGVMAGHVAAMRERFESMTRTNTPCPDHAPALDPCRNVTPSPDRLG